MDHLRESVKKAVFSAIFQQFSCILRVDIRLSPRYTVGSTDAIAAYAVAY